MTYLFWLTRRVLIFLLHLNTDGSLMSMAAKNIFTGIWGPKPSACCQKYIYSDPNLVSFPVSLLISLMNCLTFSYSTAVMRHLTLVASEFGHGAGLSLLS